MPDWLLSDPGDLLAVLPTTVGIYVTVLVATRLVGLRSLAKLSSFDFAATVAVGTLLATTAISPEVSLAAGALGVAVVFGLQVVLALVRRGGASLGVDNAPRLLVAYGEILDDPCRQVRVDRSEVLEQLRLAGVLDPRREVLAVIMETTGELSVLRRSDGVVLDPGLLDGVRGREHLGITDDATSGGEL